MSSLSIYPPETHGGIVTTWIPVTAYPSSSGCASLFWSYVVDNLAAWDPGYGISVDTNVKCVPAAATTWWDQERLGINSLTTISLGPITCPSVYTTVTTRIDDQSSTFVACCPPGYTFVEIKSAGSPYQCSSKLPADEVITYAIRDQQQSWFTTSTSYSTATEAWGIQINGYNVAPQTTSSLTSLPTSSFTSTTSSATGISSATGTPQPPSSLSTGAKAGIGVAAVFGALILGTLIAFVFVQHKRKSIASKGQLAFNTRSENTNPVMIPELEDQRGMSELQGRKSPVELH